MRARRLLAALALVAAGAATAPRHAPADVGADRATLAHLEQRSRTFYDLLARGEREKAAAAWPELAGDLVAFVERVQGSLDRMREEVMERDGDLEELYRSSRWRDPEVMSLVATYHLAWVRYQGAELTGDPAKKRALLQKAVEGFSQFLLVNEVPEIYAESLYGRGLAFLELGETAKATEDLQAAATEPSVGAKARAALEEARRRAAGGKTAPAANEPETLLGRLRELLPRAAGGDASAEKEATTLARGLAARGGVWPARVASAVAETLGQGTPASVRSSYGLFLLAQLAVDGGRCGDVAALAEASEHVTDAGRARHRPELLYLDAGCRLNAGRQREAAERFALVLHEFPDAARAREAAYYRFRALDVARGADQTLTPAFEDALTTYLARYARAEGADEARFLLAELHRSRGDCQRAETEYAGVGAGAFAARARLGALECRAAGLAGGGAPERRRAVVDGAAALVRETTDHALAARAALLGALVAAGGNPPDHAAVAQLLDGFEKRYPEARDLHPQALQLRLVARVAAGQLDAAGGDLDGFLRAGRDDDEQRRILSRLARDLTARVEHAPPGADPAALPLARKVQAALLRLTDDPADRTALADLELRAGAAAAARRLYEQVLARDAGSLEALRGAAHAAAAGGDQDAALAYWRRVLDGSPAGGTAWYEARIAQVTLLAGNGRRAQACELLRSSRGRATSAGGDALETRLRGMEPEVCR